MAPLKVNTVGTKGVNVVDSPIHLQDNDLAAGQNAEIYFEDGYPGIRKRLGLDALTPVALETPVLGLTCIPLPDPFPPVVPTPELVPPRPNYTVGLFAWHNNVAGSAIKATADGTTWIDGVALGSSGNGGPTATIGDVVYRSASTTSIAGFDGASNELLTAPASITIGASNWTPVGPVANLATDGTLLYCSVLYTRPGFGATVVFKIDPVTTTWTRIGEVFGTAGGGAEMIFSSTAITGLAWWNSRLWLAQLAAASAGIFVRSIAPATEASWTLDHDFGDVVDDYYEARLLAGPVYLALAINPAGPAPAVLQLRTTGGWTTLETSPTAGGGDYYALIYNDDRLIVHRVEAGVASVLRVSADFAIFSPLYDFGDVLPHEHTPAVKFQGNLYTLARIGASELRGLQIAGATVTPVLSVLAAPLSLGAH